VWLWATEELTESSEIGDKIGFRRTALAAPRAWNPVFQRLMPRSSRLHGLFPLPIGLGTGLAIAASALLPLSRARTGSLRPDVPAGQFAAILVVSGLLAVLALALPTRRALGSRPVEQIGVGE
jgi:predicted lysophospholipase L1 biosynthesis ABC-type transport system permease subunit